MLAAMVATEVMDKLFQQVRMEQQAQQAELQFKGQEHQMEMQFAQAEFAQKMKFNEELHRQTMTQKQQAAMFVKAQKPDKQAA